MGEILRGFNYFIRGGTFLWKTSGLKRYAIYPWLINIAIFVAIVAVFFASLDRITGFATRFLPVLVPDVWYEWILYGLLIVLKYVIGTLVVVAFLIFIYYAFFMLGMVIAAPFNDVLSQRTEEFFRGRKWVESEEGVKGIAKGAGRAMSGEVRKLIFFLVVQGALFALNFLPFIGNVFYVILATTFAMIFFGLEFTDQSMGRRRFVFNEKRRVVWGSRGLMFGFGGSIFLVFFIPLVNLISMPVGVVGGTLLYIDLEDSGRVAQIIGRDPLSKTPQPGAKSARPGLGEELFPA
ncbi:MAG: EI24 domain-containing protein [Candidatus Omnitrophota bacterium]